MARWSGARRWVLRAGLVAAVAVLGLQAWYLSWVVYWKWHNPVQTSFMAQDLERAARLAAGRPPQAQQHAWVDYAHIAANLKRAVVAAEDGRFVAHAGVDLEALQRAWDENRRRGRTMRGGSTITQQLAKNLFLSSRRSYLRKAQELAITFMIEAVWDKRRILEVYLNVVEWGDGIFGAEAGARHYFGVGAQALGPEEAARMAAMLPAPRFFDRHREAPFLEQRSQGIARLLPQAQIP